MSELTDEGAGYHDNGGPEHPDDVVQWVSAPSTQPNHEKGFEAALEGLINAFSQENGSNTPDFLLASYLRGCLENWNKHVNWREGWYGRPARPGQL